MNSIRERKITDNGYNLHVIQSKKYKTINIVLKFKAPLERESITQRALLPYILQQGTNQHPTARALRTALDDLYGAVLSIDSSKKGENHVLTVRMEVANQSYLSSSQNIFNEALQLLNQIIFHPKTNGEQFDQKIVAREKQTLKQKINSIIDDKMSYANMRLIDEMCKDEPYRLHVHGYLEDLDPINERSLYEYYQDMLVHDQLDIYVLGDLEEQSIEKEIANYFAREYKSNNREQAVQKKQIKKLNEVTEEQNIQQGKLHLGFRTNINFNDPDYFALQVFNGIFGGFPSSKLFMNVREKHSLAYYAASRYESHKGLLFVFSGIDPNNFSKAKDIILEQMDEMKKGEFTDDQVEETKNMVINQLLETMDNSQGLIEVLYHQVLAENNITPDEVIDGIKRVQKDDLLRVGNKLELDTIYFLTSKGGSNNE
ncbi:EF-P 5-aminopentanol modification-associated protein YfmF [Aquibacillus albus]|uniref:Zn-dependent peptidase n=1 Tax=Aquibacillus albus TaxID=1168171 RepID=A0ABS2N1T4_9BACI|nr:pitrilysin family protein [Aquibacillus albus]MBM7572089.1 putative Zn-dependent peptidase [Aquibacillus albus]